MTINRMQEIARGQFEAHEKKVGFDLDRQEQLEYDSRILYLLKAVRDLKLYYPLLNTYIKDEHKRNIIKQAFAGIELDDTKWGDNMRELKNRNLRYHINYRGVTIRHLAEKCGVSERKLYNIVSGKGVLPAELCKKLAKELGCLMEDITD